MLKICTSYLGLSLMTALYHWGKKLCCILHVPKQLIYTSILLDNTHMGHDRIKRECRLNVLGHEIVII